jgi:hypothetical protein
MHAWVLQNNKAPPPTYLFDCYAPIATQPHTLAMLFNVSKMRRAVSVAAGGAAPGSPTPPDSTSDPSTVTDRDAPPGAALPTPSGRPAQVGDADERFDPSPSGDAATEPDPARGCCCA